MNLYGYCSHSLLASDMSASEGEREGGGERGRGGEREGVREGRGERGRG